MVVKLGQSITSVSFDCLSEKCSVRHICGTPIRHHICNHDNFLHCEFLLSLRSKAQVVWSHLTADCQCCCMIR